MIQIADLEYTVGSFHLRLSLEIGKGEYFVLLGPTGSGKTAVAECIAGLRRPQRGRILIGGRDVTYAEPRERRVGYVPQDYALFLHRTVWGNIAFGPQVLRWAPKDREDAVWEAARRVRIESLLRRRIRGLSGGERQRVALARALAVRPDVLILDEPVNALDEMTRDTVCGELLAVQRALRLTTLHISHNLEEAFYVADRAAILREGRLEQIGPMGELLRRPRTEFVARFMRCENIFRGVAVGAGTIANTTRVRVNGTDIVVPGSHRGQVGFIVRPEHVILHAPGSMENQEGTVLPCQLIRAVDRGAYVRVELAAFQPLVAHVSSDAYVRLSDSGRMSYVAAVLPVHAVHVLGEGQDPMEPPEGLQNHTPVAIASNACSTLPD